MLPVSKTRQSCIGLSLEPQFVDLAGRLSVEWLEAFPVLSARTERQLLDCALKKGSGETVKALLGKRSGKDEFDDETRRLWLSAEFVVNFENSSGALHAAAAEDPGLLWAVRERVGVERTEPAVGLSLPQLVFIVEAFGVSWEEADWPGGTVMGSEHPWDASEFIKRAIVLIAQDASAGATEALKRLIDEGYAPTFVETMRHTLALQRKARRDEEYKAHSVAQLEAVMADALPETVDDMRAYFGDLIEDLQKRVHGSSTDMWQTFWSENGPRDELYCRDRLVDLISGRLPKSIRFEPEMHMPGQTRSDIAAIRNSIGLSCGDQGAVASGYLGCGLRAT